MRRRGLLASMGSIGILTAGCVADETTPIEEESDRQMTHASPPQPSGSWPQLGYDAHHTRHVPHATGPREHPEIVWRALGDRPVYPPVIDDRLYMSEAWTDGAVLALKNGADEPAWTNTNPAPIRWATALHDDRVLTIDRTSNNANRLYGIDTESGETEWTQRDGIEASSSVNPAMAPTIRDGEYYIGSNRGIIAGDASTGATDWEAILAEHMIETEDGTWRTDWAKPCVTEDLAITCDVTQRREETRDVYAVDRSTGDEEWTASIQLDDQWQIQPNLVAGAGYVFVSAVYSVPVIMDYDGPWKGEQRIYTIDLDSGAISWNISLDGSMSGPMAYADGHLYVAEFEPYEEVAQLTVIDVVEETVAWTYETSHRFANTPVVGEDTVYLSFDESIVAIDRFQQEKRWTVEIGESSSWSALVDETLYVLTRPNHDSDSEIIAIQGD